MTKRRRRNPSKAALISHRSHISFLDLIREKLAKENLETLQTSCFGNMFLIPELQFQGQLYNILIRHIVKSSKYQNRISFLINGRVLEFTPSDFALITGLKFNNWIDLPVESEVHRAVFKRKTSLTLDDIIVAFNLECSKCSGSSLLSLKLAYLLILYGMLLIVGGKKNNIEIRYLHLIDDLDSFNSFPWGQVAYLCLVRRSHRAIEILENIIKNNKRVAFDANGFVLALQIWAYEVIPIIARNCASVIPGTDHIVPRLRRWTASCPIKFDLLHTYFDKASGDTLRPITLSPEEQRYLTSLGLYDMKSGPILETRKDAAQIMEDNADPILHCGLASVNKKTRTGDTTPTNGNSGTPQPSVQELGSAEISNVNILASRVAELEKLMVEIKSSIPASKPATNISGGIDPMTTTPYQAVIPQQTVISPSKSKTKKKDLACLPTRMITRSTKSGLQNGEQPIKPKVLLPALSKVKNSPDPTKNGPVSAEKQNYDPNEGILVRTLVVAYEAWRKGYRKNPEATRLRFPCRKVGCLDGRWFDTLWGRRGWLGTCHMDALLNELLIARDKDPVLYSSNWSAMEMITWGALTSGNAKCIKDRVGPYVAGLQPEHGALHWARLSKVYGVGHLNGDHWVCYELSLDNYRCTVYDSRSNSTTWDSVSKLFTTVCTRIWRLCDELGVWHLRSAGCTEQKAFSVVQYKHPPQQTNHADCGVLAMKFIECLVSGNDVDIINPDRCGVFRQSYCGKIFALCEEDTQEQILV